MKIIRKITALVVTFALFITMMPRSDAFSTGASSACVMDADTGRVLYEYNSHEERPIASITKIMTGILACEYGQEDESRMKKTLVCSETANAEKGSSLYMEVGDKVLIRIVSMLVCSAAATMRPCFWRKPSPGMARALSK